MSCNFRARTNTKMRHSFLIPLLLVLHSLVIGHHCLATNTTISNGDLLGNASLPIETRIHRGKVTGRVVPYAVNLVEREGKEIYPFCAGSYLGDGWVMTAAHCLPLPKNTEIYLGTYDNRKLTFKAGVTGQWTSPTWRPSTVEGDIALIKLDKNVPQSSNIQPVCLSGYRKMESVSVTGYGWGLTSSNGYKDKTSDVLKQATGMSTEFCPDYTGTPGTRVCVWYKTDGIPDKGDSGGPLMITSGGKQLQVGVASQVKFDKNCPDPNKAAEYARVSSSLNWITSKHPGVCIDGGSTSGGGSYNYGGNKPQSPPSPRKQKYDFWGRPISPSSPKEKKPKAGWFGKPARTPQTHLQPQKPHSPPRKPSVSVAMKPNSNKPQVETPVKKPTGLAFGGFRPNMNWARDRKKSVPTKNSSKV